MTLEPLVAEPARTAASEPRAEAEPNRGALAAAPPLLLAHTLPSCHTLGPGRRGVLWVAGCSRRCPGCIAEPLQDPASGRPVAVDALAMEILGWPGLEGLTISGGEPFAQAEALAALCRCLRAARDLSLMAYSGSLREELAAGSPAQRELLGQLDLLIDGPFVRAAQRDLLWRGSANQRVHLLSARHADLAGLVDGPGAGVEIHLGPGGRLFWAGIPEPGFAEGLAAALAAVGVELDEETGGGR